MKKFALFMILGLFVCSIFGCSRQDKTTHDRYETAVLRVGGTGGGVLHLPSTEEKDDNEEDFSICFVGGCQKERILPSSYCKDHKCMQENCVLRKENNSDYCQKHKKEKEQPVKKYDPYDVYDYDDPDDFADDLWEEFDDECWEDGYDEAYDYWIDKHRR
ncbi:MAG: hypothetical protein Q4E53_14220 [Eubacteriales bacterium]|nr:hypothetical protein [Eubacteriales bacterium]